MILTTKNQIDTFLLSLGVYGVVDELVKLCNDNNLVISSTVKAGTIINYDSTLVIPITPAQVSGPINTPNNVNLKFTSKYGQNQFDVAINTYVTIDNYIKLLVDNAVDNSYIPNNKMYAFSLPLDVNVYNEITGKGFIVSTGLPTATNTPGGDFNDDFNSDFSGD